MFISGKYTLIPMPVFVFDPELSKKLQAKPEFRKVMERLHAEKLELKDVKESHLHEFSAKLCETVSLTWKKYPTLHGRGGANKEGIGAKTLQKIFSGKYVFNEFDPRSTKTLHTLIYYFTGSADRQEWKRHIPGLTAERVVSKRAKKSEIPHSPLIGFWYVYRYDNPDSAPSIKRTVLQISANEDGQLKADYKSVHGSTYVGPVVEYHDIFTITVANEDKSIEISACTPNNARLEGERVINAVIRSVSANRPNANHCILMSAGKEVKSLKQAKGKTIYHSKDSSRNSDKNAYSHKTLDPIVIYLTRNNVSRMIAKEFEPSTLKTVNKRNDDFYDNNFFKQYQALKGSWYSLARLGAEHRKFEGMTWAFTFDEAGKKCTLVGGTAGGDNGDYSGKVLFQFFSFTCLLRDDNGHPVMQLAARFSADMKKIYAVAGILTAPAPESHRLVFFREKQRDFDLTAEAKIDDVLELKGLEMHEKALIADSRNNRVAWPAEPAMENRDLEELNKFAHPFFAYIPYVYDLPEVKFFRIMLEIDAVGNVTEKVFDTSKGKGKEIVEYTGHATVLGNTLRLSSLNRDQQRNEFIFEIKLGAPSSPDYISGLSIDTDRKGSPCADACVAIRYDLIFNHLEPEPVVIDTKCDEYELLKEFFIKHFKADPEEYFYRVYPSLRKKR
jgi:hypothetical protein